MNPEQSIYLNTENNISKTGYRALFTLLELIKKPCTREELIEKYSRDTILNSDVSKDTVTITINTLKKVGCIISRPTRKTNNKYILKSHPFNISLSESNILALHSLRESIITLNDLRLLIHLNNLYAKFAHLTPNIKTKDLLLFKHPLNKVSLKILNELVIYSQIDSYTNITYISPKNGEENLDFKPEYLTFENAKLYIWGYCKKHEKITFLRVDRIKRVNLVAFGSPSDFINAQDKKTKIIYKLKGYSATMYDKNEDEKILEQNQNLEYSLTIEASVSNDFNFYQRILSYGTDCVIISPEKAKKEFLSILKNIKEGYLYE